jgi:hypothetical protein
MYFYAKTTQWAKRTAAPGPPGRTAGNARCQQALGLDAASGSGFPENRIPDLVDAPLQPFEFVVRHP